jgi:hypothetical protein
VLHLDLSTVVPGPPSWKPLPVLVTTPLALTGGAAPTLWLLIARAGALGSLAVAARLANRLAGPWAAVVAVAGLALSMDWLRAFSHGYTEPLAIGLLLAAVDQHLSRRPRHAMGLAALAALARPEVLLVIAVYGVVQWRRRELAAPFVAAVVALVAALWIVPDWLGSGDPLHAAHVARFVVAATGPGPALHALGRAALILPLPLTLAGVAGAAIALRRRDDRVLWLATVAAAWVALDVALMAAGYPAEPRFFTLPAGLWCVVGAVGALWLVEELTRPRARLAAAAALALVAAPITFARAEHSLREYDASADRATIESELLSAVEETEPALRACGGPMMPARLTWMKGAVAWELDVPLSRVHAVRTFGDRPYLERMSEPDDGPLPWLSDRHAVTIRPASHGSAFLDPFADARLRMPGRETTVAEAGPWSVVKLGGEARTLAGARACRRRAS